MGVKELRKRIRKVARSLEKKYPLTGIPQNLPVVDQMVFHHLYLNANVTNAVKAYKTFLAKHVDWNDVRVSRYAELAATLEECRIETGVAFGLRKVLESAYAEPNRNFLDALTDNDATKAKKGLPRAKGMDPVTAAYLGLVFQKGTTVPLDLHTDRVLQRMGFLSGKTPVVQRREELQGLVPEREGLDYHFLFVEHAKKTCVEREPACDRCAVCKDCEYFRALSKGGKAKLSAKTSATTHRDDRPATRKGTTGKGTVKAQGKTTARPVTERAATERAKTGSTSKTSKTAKQG